MEPVCKKNIRIIPRLDVKGPNLVKGIHLEGLRVLGKPEEFAQRYYQEGADELIYIDVVASLYGRRNLIEIVKSTAERIFIPLTAGGGVRTIDDIGNLLRAGADKVAINTAAVRNPQFIKKASNVFGSQCIVLSIQANKMADGSYEAFTDNGREKTGRNVFEWVREAVELGSGEVLITSINKEGTGSGYDIELIKKISESVSVPVIACGGAGRVEHFMEAIEHGKADAVCASSILHYHRLKTIESTEEFKTEGNVEFIRRNRGGTDFFKGRIHPLGIGSIKQFLQDAGIPCRFTGE